MTIVIAIKYNNKVVACADSGISSNEIALPKPINSSKIVQFKGFVALLCGGGGISESLEELRADTEFTKGLKVRNRLEAKAFAESFYALVKENLSCGGLPDNLDSYITESIGDLILCTKTQIFRVCADLSVYEIEEYVADGAGYLPAYGVLYDLYKNELDCDYGWLERTAIRAAEAACKFYPHECQKPIETLRVR